MNATLRVAVDAATVLLFNALGERLQNRRLAELITVNNGQGLKTENRAVDGKFDVYASGGLVGKHSVGMHSGPFVVIGRKGSAGKITFAPRGGWVTDTAYFATPLKPSELQPKFLYYALRAQDFSESIIKTAIPGINRTAIYGYSIPQAPTDLQNAVVSFLDSLENGNPQTLPHLPAPFAEEQRAISQIFSLSTKVEEVRVLRELQSLEIQQMLASAFHRIADQAPRKAMREIAPIVRRPVDIEETGSYAELGIRSFGKGTFHKPSLSGLEIGSKRVFFIDEGDLLFSNVFAWEGAIAVAGQQDSGRVGSHRFISRVPIRNMASSRFLCFYFLTDEGLEQIRAASPGGAGRNRTLGLESLDNIEVPIPPISQQLWFDALQSEVREMRQARLASQKELDALLPSIVNRAFEEKD